MKIHAIILLFFIITACNSGELNIRLKNATEYDMHNVSVNFRGQTLAYGDIKKDDYSKYMKVERAYSYAYVEWKTDNKTMKVQPEDYVGEKELRKGNYTYIITPFNGEEIYHSIELQID